MRKNKHSFIKLTFKIVYFIRFVWRALSSGALPYADISGNIRVKSQFENVTSRQFSMKINILQGLNIVYFVQNAFFSNDTFLIFNYKFSIKFYFSGSWLGVPIRVSRFKECWCYSYWPWNKGSKLKNFRTRLG